MARISVNFRLPEELVAALKHQAEAEDKDMTRLVIEALKNLLENKAERTDTVNTCVDSRIDSVNASIEALQARMVELESRQKTVEALADQPVGKSGKKTGREAAPPVITVKAVAVPEPAEHLSPSAQAGPQQKSNLEASMRQTLESFQKPDQSTSSQPTQSAQRKSVTGLEYAKEAAWALRDVS